MQSRIGFLHHTTDNEGAMTETQMQVHAFIEMAEAIAEAIEASGPRGVPSGHLYAAVMGAMDLTTYEAIIAALTKSGRVTQSGFVLTAKR